MSLGQLRPDLAQSPLCACFPDALPPPRVRLWTPLCPESSRRGLPSETHPPLKYLLRQDAVSISRRHGRFGSACSTRFTCRFRSSYASSGERVRPGVVLGVPHLHLPGAGIGRGPPGTPTLVAVSHSAASRRLLLASGEVWPLQELLVKLHGGAARDPRSGTATTSKKKAYPGVACSPVTRAFQRTRRRSHVGSSASCRRPTRAQEPAVGVDAVLRAAER